MDGLVTRFDEKRGYGFVSPLRGRADGTEPVYFHITQVLTVDHGGKPVVPTIGARLRFTIAPCARGHEAVGITIIHQAGEPQPEPPRKPVATDAASKTLEQRVEKLEQLLWLHRDALSLLWAAIEGHQKMLTQLTATIVPQPTGTVN